MEEETGSQCVSPAELILLLVRFRQVRECQIGVMEKGESVHGREDVPKMLLERQML